MDCRELKAMLDSYISDELLVETNHGVHRHLENCPDCRREMSEHRSLKLRVRQIVINAPEHQLDSVFARRLETNLRHTALRPSAWERITNSGRYMNMRAIGVGFACILILALGGIVWVNRSDPSPLNVASPNDNVNAELVEAVRVSWSEMTSQAVGDHENCAIEFHLKERPISLDDAAGKYGSFNKDLDKSIMAAFEAQPKTEISTETEFLESHSCLYDGRRFAHVVVKHRGRIVSFLVAETDLPAGNNLVQTARFDGSINAAGFQIGHHAVFVVSDLPDGENVRLAEFVAPAVRLHVGKLRA